MRRSIPTQMNVQFAARVPAAPTFPYLSTLGVRGAHEVSTRYRRSSSSRGRFHPPAPLSTPLLSPFSSCVFVDDDARYAILRVPRGANYIVRNVNLVCQAVNAAGVSLHLPRRYVYIPGDNGAARHGGKRYQVIVGSATSQRAAPSVLTARALI